MVKHHSVVGRYVTIEVDDCEYKVFYLQNGKGIPSNLPTYSWMSQSSMERTYLKMKKLLKTYNVIAYDLAKTWQIGPSS